LDKLERTARKITIILFLAQSLSSAGFIAAFTVNALVGAELSGQVAWSGLPSAVYVLGQAFAALMWGYTMERIGRRLGLAAGQAVGVVGAGIAGGAVYLGSFPLFLFGLALMGTARAAVDLGRFAAAEVHLPDQRGRAISNVVLGGTVGAVAGPLLVGPTGQQALAAGLPELAGPYSVGFVFFAVAGVMVFLGLRPDPRDVGRELAALHPGSVPHPDRTRSLPQVLRDPGVVVAMVSVVFAQLVMVMLMVITSVHMRAEGHPLGSISLVIAAHTFGMYAFSVISGRMTDRFGRAPVILAGMGVMIFACLMAAPSTGVLPLLIALFLLGLGWNFAYVAGSTMLSDQLSPAERAKTQGFNDLLLGLASATGSLGSGVVFAFAGYGAMSLVGGAAALVPIAAAGWWHAAGRHAAQKQAAAQD
jgi:MFS family permease